MAPSSPQRRPRWPKMGPKWPQDGLQIVVGTDIVKPPATALWAQAEPARVCWAHAARACARALAELGVAPRLGSNLLKRAAILRCKPYRTYPTHTSNRSRLQCVPSQREGLRASGSRPPTTSGLCSRLEEKRKVRGVCDLHTCYSCLSNLDCADLLKRN